MGISETIKKLCVKLGENNNPIYAVIAIAVAKGICRPITTMTDKHADPETKKYTALRELLTEVVAIPTYWACGELAGKVGGKLDVSPEKQALAKHNFKFLGVCMAALVVIPALASITIKPFMNMIQGKNKKGDKKEAISLNNEIEKNPTFKSNKMNNKNVLSPFNHVNYGSINMCNMKVGGPW